jgi:hypothetical protein
MAGLDTADKILWMADCYLLAKRFPDPITWLALLQSKKFKQNKTNNDINPLNYWLWMEIWKAAQTEQISAIK